MLLNPSWKTELYKSLLRRTLTVEPSGLTALTVCCKCVCRSVCVWVCVWLSTCKVVESGQGQIASSFVDELNKVISGFLERYHRVQENWLVEQSHWNFQDPVTHSPCSQRRLLWKTIPLVWIKGQLPSLKVRLMFLNCRLRFSCIGQYCTSLGDWKATEAQTPQPQLSNDMVWKENTLNKWSINKFNPFLLYLILFWSVKLCLSHKTTENM